MKSAAQIQEAIETWRSLAFKKDLSEREAEVMETVEKTILRTTVLDHQHAAAICDVVLYNMSSGGRTDSSEIKALASLRYWIARAPSRVASMSLVR